MANSRSEIPLGSNADEAPTQETEAVSDKKDVSFDIYGNIICNLKSKIKTRCLALSKSTVGLAYDDWRHVPTPLKDDVWDEISREFGLELMYKANVISQVSDQWKAWKKNIRCKDFGKTRQEILEWKDKVPPGEEIPLAKWNIFMEREAGAKKLEQRATNRKNRAKKKDVHLLGSKSYAQVYAEWPEITKKIGEEGLELNRVNLYLHAHKDKNIGAFYPNVVETAAKINEIKSTQGKATEADIDPDALTQIFGKDKRGQTHCMGSISRTKYKALKPARSEIDNVKNQDKKIDSILELLKGRSTQEFTCPSPGTGQSAATQASSSVPRMIDNAPIKGHTSYYHITDSSGKNIAMGKIEAVAPGTMVHSRKTVAPEVKLSILSVYPGMQDEPVYLGQQGGIKTIGEFECSYIAWPIYMLKEIPY